MRDAMRKHEFRAWDDIEKKMVYFNLKDYMTIQSLVAYNGEFYVKFHFMEFTGILDKNGKEIYEGDIVQYANLILRVEYGDGAFELYDTRGSSSVFFHHLGKHYAKILLTVIGNVYENPELLNEN